MTRIDYEVYDYFYPMWSKKRKNLLAPRSLTEIKEITLHHTEGGGTWNGLKRWILSKTNKCRSNYKRGVGLFHDCIEKAGLVVNCWPLDIPVFHSSSWLHDLETVGIEIIHLTGPFTETQYKSLMCRIEEIMELCPNLERITTHDYNYQKFSNGTKGCPGKDFDFKRIVNNLKKKGLKFQTNNKNIIDFTMKNKELHTYKIVDGTPQELATKQIEGRQPLWQILLKELENLLQKYFGK